LRRSKSAGNAFRVLDAAGNFLGIDACSGWDEARVVVLPAPLEATVTYMRGTAKGPEALIRASQLVEFFDDELQTETFRQGIATLPALRFGKKSIKAAIRSIEERVTGILEAGKKPYMIGGEHTVSLGAVQACGHRYSDLSVLHLDAHTDLRESYAGSPFNHSCVMARIAETCPFVSVGIRSLSVEEADRIRKQGLGVFSIHEMRTDPGWVEQSIARLGETVYVTLDLDVLDPSIMPAVGTPEPGGMGWKECLEFLKAVFDHRRVVGMDMVELSPRAGAEYGVFSAAKMAYRLMGYWLQSRLQ